MLLCKAPDCVRRAVLLISQNTEAIITDQELQLVSWASNSNNVSTHFVLENEAEGFESDLDRSEIHDSDSLNQNSIVFELAQHKSFSEQVSTQIMDV